MKKYNKLTQQLLAEGYTADNHPDYVRIGGGNFGRGDPLDNFYGGFEYTNEYRKNIVLTTGCGLLVRASAFNGSMSYQGIEWTLENNCPVLTCPLRPDHCDKRFSDILGGANGICKIFQCDCRITDEPYSYEKSIDKLKDDVNAEIEQKRQKFIQQKHGHACHWHMHYDFWKKEWSQRYDPLVCSRYCMNAGKTCDLTGKPLSKKRGNVFYDLKITRTHQDHDLFYGEKEVSIERNKRFLKSPVSVDICNEIVKRCKHEIVNKNQANYNHESYLYGTEVEVINIRVQQKESRDLFQDLEDIRNGIKLSYESDMAKQSKEAKRERRQLANQKKEERLRKILITVGYDNLDDYSLDKQHADKWFTEIERDELEAERQRLLREKENEPKQLSLFDLEGFE